jgi:cell division septum initiation protein DivIVA
MAAEEPHLELTTGTGPEPTTGTGPEPTTGTDPEQGDSEGFDRVRRGFAPDQVAEYLKGVAAKVLMLEARLEETRNERDAARAELAAARPDPYEGVSERVTELMRAFDHQVGDLQREAQAEADRVLLDVRTDADRILDQAREQAELITADAREEAERTQARAQLNEAEAQVLAERIVADARDEANRAESDIAVMRNSTLETFRDIRGRTLTALGELEKVIEAGAMPEDVVIVDEAEELSPFTPPQPRPDL